jgi:hypothetical protein
MFLFFGVEISIDYDTVDYQLSTQGVKNGYVDFERLVEGL